MRPNTSNRQIKAKIDRQGPPGTRCPDQGGPPTGRDAYDYKIFVLDLRAGTLEVTQDTAQNGADVEVYDD